MKKLILIVITFVMIGMLGKALPIQAQSWQGLGPTGVGVYTYPDMAVHPTNPLKIYVATSGGLYRSTDGGLIWSKLLSGYFRIVDIDPQNSNIIYTGPGNDNGVYKSTNGGDDWTFYNEGMTNGTVAAFAIAANSPNLLFMVNF